MITDSVSKGTILLARFIRDLIDHDEQLIKPGDLNFEREDFNLAYIVPDEITVNPISFPEKFDGEAESMNYCVVMQGQYTADFFGKEARKNAMTFLALLRSQKSYELQRDSGLTVYSPSSVVDLATLTGSQYSPRFQVTMNLRYNESLNVDTLRIETADVEVLFEQ